MKSKELAKKLSITLSTLYTYLGRYNMSKYIVKRGEIINYDMDCYFKLARLVNRRFD